MSLFSGKKDPKNKGIIEQIILENYNQYYRLAYNYVHNEADACDIVQSGACKALRSSNTIKKPEYAETWVYRIMLNECYGYLRRPEILSYEEMQEKGTETAYTEDMYVNVDLQRAIDSLPNKERAIIVMRYFEDKKLEEIADIVEENVNTVKTRLYRGMGRLRTVLSEPNDMKKIK